MAWYQAGTVTLTNGSAQVDGAGTNFLPPNVVVGDGFVDENGVVYEVTGITSGTRLSIAPAYRASSGGGRGYRIMPTPDYQRLLAMRAADLLNSFAAVRDGVGAGLFADGSTAAPAFRFAADQDTGFRRLSENAVSIVTGGIDRLMVGADGAVTIPATGDQRFSASFTVNSGVWRLRTKTGFDAGEDGASKGTFGLYFGDTENAGVGFLRGGDGVSGHLTLRTTDKERVRIDAIGRMGVGTTSPITFLHVAASDQGGARLRVQNTAAAGRSYDVVSGIPGVREDGFSIFDASAGTCVVTIDPAQNFMVGETFASHHTMKKNVAVNSNNPVFSIVGGSNTTCATFYSVNGAGTLPSAAKTALTLAMDASTGRSLSTAGTGNFTGSDYAEYMLKAAGCGRIAKGDVCGVDRDGYLTKTWADAISFVVKSTDPSLVGGDTWGADIGPRPGEPGAEPVEPVMPTMPGDDASDEERAAWDNAFADHPDMVADYQRAHAVWQADTVAYDDALSTWEAEHEKARQCVDRIAFCGQVPANVVGDFAVGDYIIAAAHGAGIKAIAIGEADITFDQYRRRIGKVWAVRDGRAWVDVQHG